MGRGVDRETRRGVGSSIVRDVDREVELGANRNVQHIAVHVIEDGLERKLYLREKKLGKAFWDDLFDETNNFSLEDRSKEPSYYNTLMGIEDLKKLLVIKDNHVPVEAHKEPNDVPDEFLKVLRR